MNNIKSKILIFAIIFVPITISLGLWQIERANEKKVIISTHPRLKKELNSLKFNDNKSSFIEPLNFTDYNCLQIKN